VQRGAFFGEICSGWHEMLRQVLTQDHSLDS
jgi:hypothetical protein